MRLPVIALAAGLALQAHAQQPVVAEAPLRAHLSLLADDLFEGRGTGQRGGDLTVRYLETQAAVLGLKPLADGTYRQLVRAEGTKLLPGSAARFTTDNGNLIIDVHGLTIADPAAMEMRIRALAGVVTVGLFAQRGADVILLGTNDGVMTMAPKPVGGLGPITRPSGDVHR